MTVTNSNKVESPPLDPVTTATPAAATTSTAASTSPPASVPLARETYAQKGATARARIRSMAQALEAYSFDDGMSERMAMRASLQVFVDESGRRRRAIVMASSVLNVVLGLFIAIAVFGLIHALALFS